MDIHPEVTEILQTPIRELTTGSTFVDRFQFIKELDHGGTDGVYRAVDKKLKEGMALKLIKPSRSSPESSDNMEGI